MDSFLNLVAKHILQQQSNDLLNTCIILPNRRASLFLKHEFNHQLKENNWIPNILSIEEFIEGLSPFVTLNGFDLLIKFYNVHKELKNDEQSFEEFLGWANTALHDFNEIDHYLIDPDNIFKAINETRALEVWNVDGAELSDFQLNYLQFWNDLAKYYEKLNESLQNDLSAYQGLSFRYVAANIEELILQSKFIDCNKFYFVGFNALNKAEETIIDHLRELGKAELLWDCDKYYIDRPEQEAGLFLRKFRTKYGEQSFNWSFNNLVDTEKNVDVINCSGESNQIQTLNHLVSEIPIDEHQTTAVILANENILGNALLNLPNNIDFLNITMGFKLSLSNCYSLIQAYLKCFESISKYTKTGAENVIYYSDFERLIRHSLVYSKDLEIIIREISSQNRKVVRISTLLHNCPPSVLSILQAFKVYETDSISGVLQAALALVETVSERNIVSTIELEALKEIEFLLLRLDEYHTQNNIFNSLKSLTLCFRMLASQISIPFQGEPLEGIQLMGMLESRTLDFKNIIILSCNEDVLPVSKGQSFIPYEYRLACGLPTTREKNAIFSYHFYRLISRANNVSLLYNGHGAGLESGEESRYIHQLKHELTKHNPKLKLTNLAFEHSPSSGSVTAVSIPIEHSITSCILELAQNGLSPSAINTFIACPLDFYYKYVIGIKEVDQLEEEIHSSKIGTYIHNTLEILYKPLVNKVVQPENIKAFKADFESILADEFSSEDVTYGKNLLIFNVAKQYIKNFLNYEYRFITDLAANSEFLTIEALELELSAPISDGVNTYQVKGKIDRVDRIGNLTRIIDYKSGMVEARELSIKELEDITSDKKYSKSLQLLIYAYMYNHHHPDIKLKSGILSLRNAHKGYLFTSINGDFELSQSIGSEFKAALSQHIGKMINHELFAHNEASTYCLICT